MYSSFYPLAAASPVLARLELEQHGLHWLHAPAVRRPPAESRRRARRRAPPRPRRRPRRPRRGPPAATATPGSGCSSTGSASATRCSTRCSRRSRRSRPARTARGRLGVHDLLWTLRMFALPGAPAGSGALRRPDGARRCITGNALHADVPAVAAVSGVFGWLLVMLGQDVGFPVPEGGAGMLARRAGVARARGRGAQSAPARRSSGSSSATARPSGSPPPTAPRSRARRAVLADVPAPTLFGRLVAPDHLPARLRRRAATVPVGPADRQGQLGARRADPVDGRRARAGRHGAPRLGRRRPGPLVRGPRPRPDPRRTTSCSSARWRRPTRRGPRGRRERLVVQPPPSRRVRRRDGVGARRADGRGASRRTPPASTTGSSSAGCSSRPTWSPTTPRSSTGRSTAAPRSCISSWSSGRCPASAARDADRPALPRGFLGAPGRRRARCGRPHRGPGRAQRPALGRHPGPRCSPGGPRA